VGVEFGKLIERMIQLGVYPEDEMVGSKVEGHNSRLPMMQDSHVLELKILRYLYVS